MLPEYWGEVMTIGDIIKLKQPKIYIIFVNFIAEEKINYKNLMEDAPVYKRHNGAWKQVRY